MFRVFPSLSVRETLWGSGAGENAARRSAHKCAVATAGICADEDKLDLTCRQLDDADQKAEIGKAVATQPEMILLNQVMAGLRPSETGRVVALIHDLRQPAASPSWRSSTSWTDHGNSVTASS